MLITLASLLGLVAGNGSIYRRPVIGIMATNWMKVILALLLPVVLLTTTVQMARGVVVVSNASAFTVRVIHVNTTLIIRALEPQYKTHFAFRGPGPHLFQVGIFEHGVQVGFLRMFVPDHHEMLLTGSGPMLYKISPSV